MKTSLTLILLTFATSSVFGESLPADQLTFFEQKIRPILIEHCYSCHSAEAKKLKGGLHLDTKAGWQRGGDSGEPAILEGNPEESLFIRTIQHVEPDLEMPPKKPKLPDAVIADLIAWVKMGAPDPRESGPLEVKRADKTWWSLQPLKAPNVPQIAQTSSTIDQFIEAKLTEKGLTFNPPAAPQEFIRRITYDLIGLPPTSEETTTFEAAFKQNANLATTALIDRLLASPHYGERWGRHWLDVVRFGESNGFERNFIIDNAWPFRDYVIRSFNEDKPFNQFIIEHLAGDVIGKDQPEIEVGSAFLTIGAYDDVANQDPIAKANIRAATVDDMVSATGSAFLGLTINCARCHHHKFDPIPTEDYYRMKAAFDGVSHGQRVIATKEERAHFHESTAALLQRKNQLIEQYKEWEKSIIDLAETKSKNSETRTASSARLTEETFQPVVAKHLRFTALATSSSATSGVGGRLDEFEVWSVEEKPRNVALASFGTKAEGATSRVAEDFDGAYGLKRVNDGQFSERWFIGTPATLTLTFAKPETIKRVTFSHDRNSPADSPVPGQGPSVTEYEIEVSEDGQTWQKVADSFDRKPFNEALAHERKLRQATSEEKILRNVIQHELAEMNAELAKVPPLQNVWAGKFTQPTLKPIVFRGGDPFKLGDEVKPSSLSVLDQVTKHYELPTDALESERRLTLGKWIASDENPLTARVLANRVWHYHFGTGLVDTPSDFGFLGSKPTHPELLDWLALRLQHHGWKLKALHREILMSRTYRQSSTYREDGANADKDARLLWRFPPRRLSAEEIRDTMLQAAGKLDSKMGGPGFRLYLYKNDNVSTFVPQDIIGPETYRRAVYHQNARASVVDVLTDFDFPDNTSPAPKRSNTTTPMQALTLLNHQFTLDMAIALSDRITRETGLEPAAQIKRAYEICFQRNVTATEQEAATTFVQTHGLKAFCRALLNANELIYLD